MPGGQPSLEATARAEAMRKKAVKV
jgi:hypothetical protein